MKNKSKKIIRTLLLSATVALLHGSAKADSKKTLSLDLDLGLGNGNASPGVSKGPQPIVKNMYKILRSGNVKLIAGHRSHRSHSSHRSSRGGHYSHSSSSHYSHSSSSYGNGYSSGTGTSSVYTPPPKTAGDYTLGDRDLATGIYGSDVDQLVPYLVRYYYLKDGVVSKKGAHHVYDANVMNAVRHFQKDAGLTQDGKLTSSAISTLKSWSASRTTIPLGFRGLSPTDEPSGFDVDELVQLLINAGFSPDPAKLKISESHYVFTNDLYTAIKMFQAYKGLRPSGHLTPETLSKLKMYKK